MVWLAICRGKWLTVEDGVVYGNVGRLGWAAKAGRGVNCNENCRVTIVNGGRVMGRGDG